MAKFIHYNCNDGQSIFAALDYLKSEGLAPSNATVSDVRRYNWNDEKKNTSIIGEITVRRDEMFAIIAK